MLYEYVLDRQRIQMLVRLSIQTACFIFQSVSDNFFGTKFNVLDIVGTVERVTCRSGWAPK